MHHVQSLNWTRTCIRQRLPLPSIPTLGSFPCIPGVYWEKYWVSEPSPDPCLHSAADIRCHTSPSGGVHTYMHIPKYVLAITNPFIAFPCHCHLPSRHASPLSWTTNSQCPGTTPISHRVSKLETHIFVIITHLGAQVDSWVCRGRHFDERETAALVLVVSRTWGGGGFVEGANICPSSSGLPVPNWSNLQKGLQSNSVLWQTLHGIHLYLHWFGNNPISTTALFLKAAPLYLDHQREESRQQYVPDSPPWGGKSPPHQCESPSQWRRLPSSCSPTK